MIGAGPMMSEAQSADTMPVKAGPITPAPDAWWFHGYLEAGGRAFLNNPQRNGVNSAGQNSLAKYYEYSTIKPGAFLDGHLATGSNNGLYQVDIWAKNVGYSDEKFNLGVSQAGVQYFNFGWDQTPHVYSTSAQTLYNGVGSNALTLPAGLSAAMALAANGGVAGLGHYGTNANAFTAADATAVRNLINANVQQTDIGIRRDTASVEYRYTPTANWDINVNYDNMHRKGTQADSVVFAWGTSGVKADVPKPVDDTTQNYGLDGEYAGTSPWGKKFNFKLAYNGSTYTDASDSYTVDNPFCPAGAVGAGSCDRTGSTSSPLARMSMWPDNQANSFTGTLGADLPLKSRYMGTASYTMMRQNQGFIPFTITAAGFAPALAPNGQPWNSTAALPASSLNGAINTLLLNNVLTSQITSDLKSKLSYRYYDFHNDTPSLAFAGAPGTNTGAFIGADGTVVTNYPSPRSVQASYTRQNAGAELAWRATRDLNLGAAYGYERYDRTFAEVPTTNENSGKIFGDWKPANWLIARASYTHSGRRMSGTYDNYNNVIANMWAVGGVGGLTPAAGLVENQAYRNYMYSDRDRDMAKFSLAIDLMPRVTLTPTAGLKYDNYLNNINLGSLTTSCGNPLVNINCVYAGTYSGVPLIGTQPGLKSDKAWNWGAEVSVVATPATTFMFSYMRENADKDLFFCGNSAAGTGVSAASTGFCSAFSASTTNGTGAPSGSNETRMKDKVNTFMIKVRHEAIPDKLDFDFGYTLSIAESSQTLTPGTFNSYGTSAAANNFPVGTVSQVGGLFPDTKTTFQRFDAMAKYKFDQDVVRQLGYKGEIFAKLRYAYESNKVTNWQNDMMQTYMYSANNLTLPYQTWLAGNNPNYNVHLIAASLGIKW
jgi:MtrB/PioB family decaheme-associated outer membrane protein